MAYFKLEFGFGRSKSKGKISDSANQADEQAVLEIRGWDFVKGEVERAKQQGRFKVAGNYLTAARSFTKFIGSDNWLFSDMTAEKLESYQRWLLGRNICLNTCSVYMRACGLCIIEHCQFSMLLHSVKCLRGEPRPRNVVSHNQKFCSSKPCRYSLEVLFPSLVTSSCFLFMRWECLLLILPISRKAN